MSAYETTVPDGIAKLTGEGPASLVQASQTQGDSTQAARLKRMRFDFVGDDAADRTAQTGMVQGSRGYQIDTRSEYIYDSSNWRLQLAHIEFTASQSTANATLTLCGTFTLDSTASTNTTFVTPISSGRVQLVDPGIYAVSTVTTLTAAATGRSFLDASFVQTAGDQQRMSIVVGEDRGSLGIPNVRSTVANQNLYFEHYQTTGGTRTVGTRLRITRVG